MPTSFRAPPAARRAARRALEIREGLPPSRRGGTPVGLRRASQIANGEPISIDTLRRMVSFFARHGDSPGSAEARRDPTSKAAQAWGLWGGNAGRAWARRKVAEYDRKHADK